MTLSARYWRISVVRCERSRHTNRGRIPSALAGRDGSRTTQSNDQRIYAGLKDQSPPANPDRLQITVADKLVKLRLADIEHCHCAGDPDTNRGVASTIRVARRFCAETIADCHFSSAHDLPAAPSGNPDRCRERREACKE